MTNIGGVMLKIAAMSVTACLLMSCGGGDGSNPPFPRQIDIVGANSLVLTGNTGHIGAVSVGGAQVMSLVGDVLDPYSIYKLNDEGALIKSSVVDEGGAEIPGNTLKPKSVERLSPDFILITFTTSNDIEVRVIVDIDSGLAYDASDLPVSIKWTDHSDSAIYIASWSSQDPLIRVRRGIDDALEIATLPTGPDQIGTVAGDSGGNFVTYVGERSFELGGGTVRRFIALNVNPPLLTNITTVSGHTWDDGSQMQVSNFNMKGTDGHVYAFAQKPGESAAFILGVDSQGLPVYTQVPMDIETSLPEGVQANFGLRRVVMNDKILFASTSEDIGGLPLEVDLGAQRIFQHAADLDLCSSRRYVISVNYFWYMGASCQSGKDIVVRYDPAESELLSIQPDVDIEISTIEIISSNRVLISGYSAALQADVRGYLEEAGGFEVDEIFNRFRESMIQIYPLDI